MPAAYKLASLCIALGVTACAADGPVATVIVRPGSGKTAAAFQQDQLICQSHAFAQTGYGDLTQPPNPPATEPAPAVLNAGDAENTLGFPKDVVDIPYGVEQPLELSYVQCMAARGDTVLPAIPDYSNPYAGYVPGYPAGAIYPDAPYGGLVWAGLGWGGWGWRGHAWPGYWHGGGWGHGGHSGHHGGGSRH